MRVWRNIAVFCVMAFGLLMPERASAQFYAVYGNGLLLPTATINVGVNIGLSSKVSLDLAVMGNPLKTKDFSTQFAMFQPGVRFWLSEIQYANFIGVHLFTGIYDVGNAEFHTRGFTAGLGVSWGYNWYISRRFNIGVEIGVGVGYMKDTRENYYTPDTDDHYIYHATRLAILPTKFAVNFVYLF